MASSPLKRLAGQTAIYGMSSIVGRMVGYLLVPFHTYHVFAPEEYGIVTLLYSYIAFLMVVLIHGMETGFFRFFEKNKNEKAKVFSSALFSVSGASILFAIVVSIFNQSIADILGFPGHGEYILLMAVIVALDAIISIPFARLRAENRPIRFAVLKIVNILSNVGFNVFFLWLCPLLLESGPEALRPIISTFYKPGFGVGYVFVSVLLSSIITLLLLLPVIFRDKFEFSATMWRKIFAFSIPLAFVGLAGVANINLDKILLRHLLPVDDPEYFVGIYGACYKISIIMVLFIQAFRFAAEPFFFSQESQDNARQTYALVLKYFLVFCLFIFLVTMFFIDIVGLFVGSRFREGLVVVPILLMANLFLGIYFNLSIWYKLTDKTWYGAIITLVGTLVTIVLNVLLIPKIGYLGSAWAALACYFSMVVISYFFGKKHYPIPYETGRMALLIVGAVGLYFLSLALPDLAGAIKHLSRILLLAVFAIFVMLVDRGFLAQFKRVVSKINYNKR
jgi:O-antigen/teichoic acid export membrane protein